MDRLPPLIVGNQARIAGGMSKSPPTDSHRRPQVGAARRTLALAAALIALTTASGSAAHLKPHRPTQSATTTQAASGPGPTTVIKETVVKRTNGDPTLPIVLSAGALAVALGAAAHTLARRNPQRNTPRTQSHTTTATKPGEPS